MHSIASIQQLLEPLFPGLMGVRLVELTPERVVAQMVVRPDLCTAGGILHGGAYMAPPIPAPSSSAAPRKAAP